MSLFFLSSRAAINMTFRRAIIATAIPSCILPQQQQSSRNNSNYAAPPLSRQEAQDLLDSNPLFRQAVNQFTTYRDIAEGQLGGPTVDLVDKAIQLDYGIRLRSSLFEARNNDCCEC
jgi:hypothetical protein